MSSTESATPRPLHSRFLRWGREEAQDTWRAQLATVSKVRRASRGSHLAFLILQEPAVVSPYSSDRAAQDCTIEVWDFIC